MLDLVSVKDEMASSGKVSQISDEINVGSWPLDTAVLRGALLTIMDTAADALAVSSYRKLDEQFTSSKRPVAHGVPVFVPAARPSAELIEAAKLLGLREDRLAGGFNGRADIAALVNLGRDYNCTVRAKNGKDTIELV